MGFLGVLQPDLRGIANEARRKQPEIKDAAERAEMKLRALEDQYQNHAKFEDDYLEAVKRADEVLKPFTLALETKNVKLITIAVGSIQKIISRNGISTASVPGLLKIITQHLDTADENILLKILQTMVTLLTSNIQIHGAALSDALRICVYLHQSKNSIVKNTAGATLRQSAINLLDRAAAEMKVSAVDIKNPELHSSDAYFFIQDICKLTGGDQAAWLKVKKISAPFGMELLESILSSHADFFRDNEDFLKMLKELIFPLVVKCFKLSKSFPTVLRLLRLVDCIIRNFCKFTAAESEVLLSRLIRILQSTSPSWINGIILEIFGNYFENEEILLIFFANYDSRNTGSDDGDSKILKNIINSIGQYVQYITTDSKSDQLFSQQIMQINKKKRKTLKLLEMLNHNEPPSIEKLWISLFTEMKQLCLDQRFEVRNCSLITLVKTLTTHGAALHIGTWEKLIWDIFFPMLEDIRVATSAAATDEVTVELGKQGGRSVKLLVHHSRNSVQKQWNETVLLSYGGIVRVLRTFSITILLPKLAHFDHVWNKVVQLGQHLALTHSKEVAESVLSNFKELFVFLATDKQHVFARSYWLSLWESCERISDGFSHMLPYPSETTTLCLSSMGVQLLQSHMTSFQAEDLERMMRILRNIVTSCTMNNPSILYSMQKDVLLCFRLLFTSPMITSDEHLFLMVFQALNQIVSAITRCEYLPSYCPPSSSSTSTTSLPSPRASTATTADEQFFLLLLKIIDLIHEFYPSAPDSVKGNALKDITHVFGSCIQLKHSHYACPVWKNTVPILLKLLSTGTPFLQDHCTAEQTLDTWNTMYSVLSEFLLHSSHRNMTTESKAVDAEFDIQILNSITNELLPIPAETVATHEKFIHLIAMGCEKCESRENFALACYSALFRTAGHNDTQNEWRMNLARITLPILVTRCETVLVTFVQNEQRAGNLPLSRHSLNEIVFIFTQLKQTSVHTSLPLVTAEDKRQLSSVYDQSDKRHLLYLFPYICVCVTTKEDILRPLIKQLLHQVAVETNLQK